MPPSRRRREDRRRFRLLPAFLRRFFLLPVILILLALAAGSADTREIYAERTGKGFAFCHVERSGGPLNTVGLAYVRNGFRYPVPDETLRKAETLRSPFHRTLRLLAGYLHLTAAVIFFGAIFYVHIFIRPTRLRGGLPRQERILGVSSMIVLTVTGIYLTWSVLGGWRHFFDNTFGLLLFIKICLFALMVCAAILAITVIHRGMVREGKAPPSPSGEGKTGAVDLGRHDGADGRRAYVAFQGRVYDVTESDRWKGGRHFGKHTAGADLTASLKGAPHGAEVFERVKMIGDLAPPGESDRPAGRSHRIFVVLAYTNLGLVFLILFTIALWRWGPAPVPLAPKKAGGPPDGGTCLTCHRESMPALCLDWEVSRHARLGVSCHDCHQAAADDPAVHRGHLENTDLPIAIVVTPRRCAACHPGEAEAYERSKHAHTLEIIGKIDRWLRDGMNNDTERATGCYACHGTVVRLAEARPLPGSWPNVGVGRLNPDGSLGSCSSCHTRHRFSIAEARKPEACDQCHLGPDHPQIEIYNESKHGTIYHAEGGDWNWTAGDGTWTAGRDYRAPTCAACHMSAASGVSRTHDVTERLSWETQAPLTVRPQAFEPLPARTDWRVERAKMTSVCRQCHSETWAAGHFENLDAVVRLYNETYYLPVKQRMDALYEKKLLTETPYFDDPLEWEFYEFWHHEGRRARMGAAMMAPDYAWWHGFYELKHRFGVIMTEAAEMEKTGVPSKGRPIPGQFGKRE